MIGARPSSWSWSCACALTPESLPPPAPPLSEQRGASGRAGPQIPAALGGGAPRPLRPPDAHVPPRVAPPLPGACVSVLCGAGRVGEYVCVRRVPFSSSLVLLPPLPPATLTNEQTLTHHRPTDHPPTPTTGAPPPRGRVHAGAGAAPVEGGVGQLHAADRQLEHDRKIDR